MKRRITLADLSRKTGLSKTTISMILTRRQDVSFAPQTIQLVQNAARDLGYIPHPRKDISLFTRRTIMVVCPYLINHYYSAVVQTLQSLAAEMQCNVLVYTTYNSPDGEARLIRVMAETDIGGIIFAMMPQSWALVRKISKNIPVVVIADKTGDAQVDIIELHNYEAGALVARHLHELGHKDIIFISTPLTTGMPARAMRYEGLRDTWRQLCPDGCLKLYTNFITNAMVRDNIQMERLLGMEIVQAVLEQEGAAFSAIVAVNDMLAYGALDALAQEKINVPGDMSVCGLDNDFPSDLAGVRLTSVEHFMIQNAQEAFRLLYHKMLNTDLSSEIRQVKVIRPELKPRASTAMPPAAAGSEPDF